MARKRLTRLFAAALALTVLAMAVSGTRGAQAAPASTIVVNESSDESGCTLPIYSLRCAIDYANANPGTYIRFEPGLQAVLLQSALPAITGNSTWIDGHDVNGGCVCPRIDASAATSWTGNNGLTINASFVTISNMKIVNIPSGADVAIVGGKDIEISYDYLGILPGASQCGGLSQATVGVDVVNDRAGGAGTNDNGVAYIFADTISCHGGSGIEVVNSNYVYIGTKRDDQTPFGNYIGTTADGAGAAGNHYDGVRVAVSSDNISIRNNRIAYNAHGGVTVDGSNIEVVNNTLSANYWGLALSNGSSQLIVGNNVGTSPDGKLPLPNTHEGILISGGSGINLSDNLVAYNGGTGIAVTGSSTHASIQNNEVRSNGGLPIDLGNDGPTLNGVNGISGPNNWLPYPVVTAFSGNLVLGTACANCVVYVFKAVGNPAAPHGGGIFVTNIFASGSGQWSIDLAPYTLTRLDVTFTAAGAGGNSSEMSPRPVLFLPLVRR